MDGQYTCQRQRTELRKEEDCGSTHRPQIMHFTIYVPLCFSFLCSVAADAVIVIAVHASMTTSMLTCTDNTSRCCCVVCLQLLSACSCRVSLPSPLLSICISTLQVMREASAEENASAKGLVEHAQSTERMDAGFCGHAEQLSRLPDSRTDWLSPDPRRFAQTARVSLYGRSGVSQDISRLKARPRDRGRPVGPLAMTCMRVQFDEIMTA